MVQSFMQGRPHLVSNLEVKFMDLEIFHTQDVEG